MKYHLIIAALLALAGSLEPARAWCEAESTAAASDIALDKATRRQVLEGLQSRLRQTYVFPEMGEAMAEGIRVRTRRGEYDRISSGRALAETLTVHLRAMSKDTHVQVHFSPKPLPPMGESPSVETAEDRDRDRRDYAWINNGFMKVERLRGNVGLLDLDAFVDPAIAGETAVAAMSFLSNCDALIVDLRYNTGGDSRMVAMLCSYLFDESVHLTDIYSRPENFTKQTWSSRYVPGKRLLEQQVFVLTSKRTHSAAEEFAFDLRNLERATIVGETTRGGAHPVGRYRLTANFGVQVPEGRAISPVTKTNWEGTGIKPDVEVPSEKALERAHVMALESLAQSGRNPERRQDVLQVLESLRGGAK